MSKNRKQKIHIIVKKSHDLKENKEQDPPGVVDLSTKNNKIENKIDLENRIGGLT